MGLQWFWLMITPSLGREGKIYLRAFETAVLIVDPDFVDSPAVV